MTFWGGQKHILEFQEHILTIISPKIHLTFKQHQCLQKNLRLTQHPERPKHVRTQFFITAPSEVSTERLLSSITSGKDHI